jgi:hypothetical protein
VRRKPLSSIPPSAFLLSFFSIFALCHTGVTADGIAITNRASQILGATTCSSTSCHGGAGPNQNQFLTWSLRDVHSQRPFATLTTARSKQIGDALGIKDAAADERCTACHAPLQAVPPHLRAADFKVNEGVSCESCHSPAESWLRGHTRPDWTRADRTFAGLRDLKNLYVRANTCVACHQTVELPLLKAGHPELIFELDGQSVAEPRHWREPAGGSGALAWLVGQAVALRELSWQLSRETAPDEQLAARWHALLWLLQRLDGLDPGFPSLGQVPTAPEPRNFGAAQKLADDLARHAAGSPWTDGMSRSALRTLAATGSAFRNDQVSVSLHARRAERLVLALDRLLAAEPARAAAPASAKLNNLFKLAQSLPDFDPAAFAVVMEDFAREIGSVGVAR